MQSYDHNFGREKQLEIKSFYSNPHWNAYVVTQISFKGSPDPTHFILEIIVGKSRIRRKTTQKLNDDSI